MANTLIFFTHIFAAKILMYLKSSKTINLFENTLATTANGVVINMLVKLMMLWTTEPWSASANLLYESLGQAAARSEKVSSTMCKMCRFTSSCICSKFHPGLCSPFIHSVASIDSDSRQWRPWLGPEVIKLFSCSTQLSMKFVLLINLKLLTIANSFLLNIAEHENFSANKYANANYC